MLKHSLSFCIFLLPLVMLLAWVGCAKNGEGNNRQDVEVPAVANHLQYDAGVPGEQVTGLNEAISALYLMPISDGPSAQELRHLLKIENLKPVSLQAWFEERVHVIFPSHFKIEERLMTSKQNFNFPEPNLFGDDRGEADNLSDSRAGDKAKVLMSNVGAEVYAQGKKRHALAAVASDNLGPLVVRSPRAGLLQIGEGLFPENHLQNIAEDLFHMTILFHEARHSDGHGKTQGFFHTHCPVGHDYEGALACDLASNGPYAIGAKLLAAWIDSCAVCNERSKESMRLFYLDQIGRVLDGPMQISGPNPQILVAHPQEWDDRPEGVDKKLAERKEER